MILIALNVLGLLFVVGCLADFIWCMHRWYAEWLWSIYWHHVVATLARVSEKVARGDTLTAHELAIASADGDVATLIQLIPPPTRRFV